MKISAQEEYGLRCMLQLARHEGAEPLTISEIAEQEALSVAYVGKLMMLLRKGELVTSVRGRSGGYQLQRDADQITLVQVLRALGGKLFEVDYCEQYTAGTAPCVHVGNCSIRSVWGALGLIVEAVLTRTTLSDLLSSDISVAEIMRKQLDSVAI